MASDITREELDAKFSEHSARADARFHEFLKDAETQRREQREEMHEFLTEVRKANTDVRLEVSELKQHIAASRLSSVHWSIGTILTLTAVIIGAFGLWSQLA
ncbi:coiled-coil domain-containing protein [Vreelandella jeotgali]|uniref:coiled-coil domain-containing protein n=1 Tax=Vreelandella jeotgali TaxID=553386 RepID=UPI00034CE366|nr:coiled-coil domain-containing protein [Halomonas jeotgali]